MITVAGIKIEPTRFPDGTTQVWKLPPELLRLKQVVVDWRFEREDEFFTIAQLRDLLRTPDFTLRVPYLPYARQDKDVSNDKTFALASFAPMLNALHLKKVVAWDVHNPSACAMTIERFYNYEPATVHAELIEDLDIKTVIFPDRGAAERYPWLANDPDISKALFEKVRDQATGAITGHKMVTGKLLEGRCLIVDDLCDGGATFLSIERRLREVQVRENYSLHLFVTHGLWSKGRKILEDAGLTLWTTNSLPRNPEGIPLPDGL